jgi:hypothetical protein
MFTGSSIDQAAPSREADIPAELLELAPLHLPNLRSERYDGDGVGVSLETFAPADQEIIGRVYGQLNELLSIFSAGLGTDFAQLGLKLRALGQATFGPEKPDQAAAKAAHDIRGGALTVLLLRLEIARAGSFTKDELRTLFMLARDHCKIMRSAISDLDPIRARKDEAPQSHHIRLLLEKWHEGGMLPGKCRHRPGFLQLDGQRAAPWRGRPAGPRDLRDSGRAGG